FTWSGSNTFRFDSSTETGGGNYTFANNLGAKNYTGLELYGTSTLARPITLDGAHGGTLLLNGATATVTGGITLTGTVSVTASGTASALTSVISGGGSLTKFGTGTLTLKSANLYTGETTVSAGTLALLTSTSLGATPALRIAESAKVDLATGITQTVGTLYLNGVQQAKGTWGALDKTGVDHTSGYFTGSGVLDVQTGLSLGTLILLF
ncbi:MAG: autotransporter-associated beta strand repeat-containing protein, partial [bacterium]